jgi:hypothetical protein
LEATDSREALPEKPWQRGYNPKQAKGDEVAI